MISTGFRRNVIRRTAGVAIGAAAVAFSGNAVLAADHHVDGKVVASGDGRSPVTAWKSFASIRWSSVRPGDTIHVAAGAYAAPLTVSADGTAAAPITIQANGTVILDGRNSQATGIAVESDDHVAVRGFTLRNFTGAGIRLSYCRGCGAEGNDIFAPARGVRVFQTTDAFVRGNKVTTPTFANLQTDGIYSQENVRARYERNFIVISNAETSGHDDGIQSYRDTDLHIEGNYVEQRNPKTGNAQGIFAENATGTHKVVNNVVYGPNTKNALAFVLNRLGSGYSGAMHIYNNTLVGSEWGVVQIENSPSSQVKNNILFTSKRNGHGVTITGTRPQPASIDHNLYWMPNGTPGRVASGGDYSWSRWQGLGYERNGISADPLFDAGLVLTDGSPAIDKGAALPEVATDYLAVARPQGAGYNIGAFE